MWTWLVAGNNAVLIAPPLIAWSPYGKHAGSQVTERYPDGGVAPGQLSGYAAFESPDPLYWTARGYAVINADIPGSWHSGGNATFLSPEEAACGRDFMSEGEVDSIGNFSGGGEVRFAQQKVEWCQAVEVQCQATLHASAGRDASYGGMIDLFAVGRSAHGISSNGQRTLGRSVDLSVGTVEGGQQQHAAFETFSVADGGYGYVHRRSRAGKGRQTCCDENRSDILDAHGARGNLYAHALQDSGQRLNGEDGLLFVASAVQSDDHTVADQRIFAHAFHTGQIANLDLDGLDSVGRQGGQEKARRSG